MKKIILITAIILLTAVVLYSQQSQVPALGKDTNDSLKLLLWQQWIQPTASSERVSAAPGLILKASYMSDVSNPVNMTEPGGYRLKSLRVLDTINGGDSLQNTLFAYPVFRGEFTNMPLDGFTYNEEVSFGYVNLDSTATQRVVVRNAGNTRLEIPVSNLFDTTQRVILPGEYSGQIYFERSNPKWANEVQWQTRTTEPEPIQGEPLEYDNQLDDNINIALDPGDTASFYIDVRPTALGKKLDTLEIELETGFSFSSYHLPVSVLSDWTVYYDFGKKRVRPSTPSYDGNFSDTMWVSNNMDARTRITSMRMAISFDPQNIYVRSVTLNPDAFPAGWQFNLSDITQTERYGLIFFEAYAENNVNLKQTAVVPEDLSYFEAGSNGEKTPLLFIDAKQLLGTNDTTFLRIDTIKSVHNYSEEYLFAGEEDIMLESLPNMDTKEGMVIVDSLMFKDKLILSQLFTEFEIMSLFPNPAGTDDEINLSVYVYKSDIVPVEVGFINPFDGTYEGPTTNMNLEPGNNDFQLDITSLSGNSYFVYVKSEETTDLWLLNILR